jgi:hypothetical protein
MFKAKLLITLALIGCINLYFDDPEIDLAKTRTEPANCAVYSALGDIKSASADRGALSAEESSCSDRKSRRDPAVI